MLEFAVTVKGMDDGKARWVLAVEGDRLLIVHEDKSLQWHKMEDCKFAKLVPPDMPRPVIPMQPKQDGLVVPTIMPGGN